MSRDIQKLPFVSSRESDLLILLNGFQGEWIKNMAKSFLSKLDDEFKPVFKSLIKSVDCYENINYEITKYTAILCVWWTETENHGFRSL